MLNIPKKAFFINTAPDLVTGNYVRHVTEISVREHFGTSKHYSVGFNIVMEKDGTGPRVKILKWDKVNFGGIMLELSEDDWVRLFASKGASGKYESFKMETRAQG